MLLLFILLSACLAEPAPAAAAPAEPPKVYACNKDILRSYMLRGRETSTPEKMILCPAIKSNCCTKMDNSTYITSSTISFLRGLWNTSQK